MNYHKITQHDIANGDGVRVVLWVSGCDHHCKGCHNPQTWDVKSGKQFCDEDFDKLVLALKPDYIQGLTISGGDPLHPDNRDTIRKIVMDMNNLFPSKDIWIYTGYRWEEVRTLYLMRYVDVLVDGEYVEALRDLRLDYCGSSNQRIIDVKKSLDSGEIVLYKV